MKTPILYIIFMAYIYTARSRVNSGHITWWCNQTPYPQHCIFHMIHGPWRPPQIAAAASFISRTHFRDMAIQVAMNHAIDSLNHIKRLGPKLPSYKKARWTNCVELYDNTVFQFKKIVFSYINPNPSDIQTWLSAALTNLQFCQNGLFKLKTTHNLTKLVSNTLAVNKVILTEEKWSIHRENSWFPERLDQILSVGSASVVVSQDGLGDFSTIQQALDASERVRGDCERFTIYVKAGVYNEYIAIKKDMRGITLLGDGVGATIITGTRSHASGYITYDSATVKIIGDGFIARGITFQNTAGPESGQAVALVSLSDRSVFYSCSFEGYQDTLFVFSQRQFYQDCNIYGTIDFIFGNAAVVLQNCNIFVRKPLQGAAIVITAQGRDDPNTNTGISIMNSRVIAAPELLPIIGQYKTYLGRPWQRYSCVVFMQTFLDSLVDPAGWLPWDDNLTTLSTLFYGEFRNYGPGSSIQGRVNWPGYKAIIDDTTAQKFTVTNLIDGQLWLPNTGVPFISGLN